MCVGINRNSDLILESKERKSMLICNVCEYVFQYRGTRCCPACGSTDVSHYDGM